MGGVAEGGVGTGQHGRLDGERRRQVHGVLATERLVLGELGRIGDESSTTTNDTEATASALSQISSAWSDPSSSMTSLRRHDVSRPRKVAAGGICGGVPRGRLQSVRLTLEFDRYALVHSGGGYPQ